jgi:hypothetical protein
MWIVLCNRLNGRPQPFDGGRAPGCFNCSLWWFGCFDLPPPEELYVQMHIDVKRTTVKGRMFEFVVPWRLNAPSTSDEHLQRRLPNFEFVVPWRLNAPSTSDEHLQRRLPNFESVCNCRAETEKPLIILPSGIWEEWCLWGVNLWENRGVVGYSLVNVV